MRLSPATITERTDTRLILSGFEEEMDEIVASHRFTITQARAEASRLFDEWEPPGGNWEDYDGGDAYDHSLETLGFDPYAYESQAGLMWLARAISLAEVTLARLAAMCFEEPEAIVVHRGGTWRREDEVAFYSSCLVTPFKTDGNGFRALQELRDLYAHGYGIPAVASKLDALARKLHSQFHQMLMSPPSDEEEALGYDGKRYFFGEHSSFNLKEQKLESEWILRASADMSPLMTYRILLHIKQHVLSAYSALTDGIRTDLTMDNCDFFKVIARRDAPRT